ncbi:hypothetical protein L226DRAFT_570273 [Lentinus tigrinus ALCF2SS1-7]|uniref:Proteophosphoglycan ppg4 n=1 Tax=Lentinus tigrinus ALCF2SS1-6 TaxID=1328759 RepID=A0A5C2SCZ4_9APHY|nr:hypothetical protein L227DRAFT_610145 [Lentinus tigrinus ALCF2SS1-6]RPD76063.1 hypothetical protein L226DRAFT_570273 [Lentinus tigrinus ALCF2SS1-7]
MYSIHVLIALVTSSCMGTALAAPSLLLPRASDGDSGGSGPMSIQPQIWIPLVVIAALFIIGTIVACSGRRLRRSALLSWGNGAAQAAGVTTGTTPASGAREITADQLVGSQRGNSTTANNSGTNRSRRPRRTRRTPSQISTHSLPAYMKEPGEQEIVIVRGADGMEDDIPITVEMPPVDEHGADTPDGSLDLTHPPTMYAPVPPTSNDVPLLHGGDLDSRQHLSPDHPGMATRASFDSAISSAEDSSQHYLDDAPPYETVILNDEPANAMPPSYPPATAAPATASPTERSGSTRRRSVFASIFNPRHSRGPSATSPPPAASPEPRSSSGHTREGSGPSVMSVQAPEQRRSRMIRHQPSHSGSGSMFSLLSRTRSNGNLSGAEALTSPSMLSLHSISSPLTHTLVKTELTYPKGGPTPDQLRLIASRESFMRFGKPYGADAIAYAASSSRIDLEPPPGFEEVAGPSGSGAGPSGSSSPPPGRDSPNSGSSHGDGDEDGHASGAAASSSRDAEQEEPVAEPHVLTDVEEVDSPVTAAPNAVLVPEPASPSSPGPVESIPATSPTSTAPPPAVSSSEYVEPSNTAPPSSSPPVQPAPSASDSLSAQPSAPQTTSNAPPSAFKAAFAATPTAGSFPARATSRASSYMSYATAEESLHTPSAYDSQFDLSGREDAYESAAETAPPTPRITPRHTHEETDTTIHG